MEYITNVRFRLPKDKKGKKIRTDLNELLQILKIAYGGVKLEWYKSKIPKTILGSIKNSVKSTKKNANHVIVKWDKMRLMEFYYGPSKIFGFKLNGYFYNKNIELINHEEIKKLKDMVKRYNMKVYTIPLLEYGLGPIVIIVVLIVIIIIKIVQKF